MSQGKSGKSIIPSGKAIGFMVIRGFGLFLSVSGMVGITLVLGPLDSIIKGLTFTPIFESKAYAFLFCLLMAVVGGALDFVANLGLKRIEES
jgi:asparagine N-glycosylation enzyme membrane subunit Stt3